MTDTVLYGPDDAFDLTPEGEAIAIGQDDRFAPADAQPTANNARGRTCDPREVPCPRCGDHMTADLVVCWHCWRDTNRLDGIEPVIAEAWEAARDKRVPRVA